MTWEHGSNWPTVAIGNYIDRKEEISPWGSCTDNWLHRPVADGGKFGAPLPLKPSFCALSMLFTDWNRSGTPSLRVSNDREYYEGGQEQMWTLDARRGSGAADRGRRLEAPAHLGHGHRQLRPRCDGYPEYFLTSMADNKLQTLAALPPGPLPSRTTRTSPMPRA